MEGPGMSLFQGTASIHINNSAQDRLQEQEELEDQKRRNEELKHKLANAFDDLVDDDEASSVNSSGNFTLDPGQTNGGQPPRVTPPSHEKSVNNMKEILTFVPSLNPHKEVQHVPEITNPHCDFNKLQHLTHINYQEDPNQFPYSRYGAGDGQNNYFHQEHRGHMNSINNPDAKQEYMNTEQLKVMYEMRVKECHQLASQMEKLDTEIDSLRARLAAAVNDRDKAELSLQEAHHLLASSKHKMIELEQQVTVLTERLAQGDQERDALKLELRAANLSLQEVQQRLHATQVARSHDTDALFREQQDRYREEVDRLQNDLLAAKNRLGDKEQEVQELQRRCMEKDREKEEIIIEKGATINRLASELETAQSRLASGETARLKEKVAQLSAERNAAKEQVKELGSKLEVTAHELVLSRNKLAANQNEFENWRSTLHQILVETLPDNAFIGEPPSPGKLATLKEVLNRYKQQMQKFSILQEDLAKRDKKIELHRKQESELRAKLDEHKGVEMQLNSRIAVLQNKLELLGSSSDSELLESYKQQNERLQSELDEVRSELKTLDLKYTELEMEYEKLKSEKGSRATRAQETNEDLLRELEKYSSILKEKLKENGELKTLYLQACSARDSLSRELKDLQSKIEKERELYKSQQKEYVENMEKQKQHSEKLGSDLTSTKEELERANKRISELQKEFTDKQKEFTDKLNKYLTDEKNAMRQEMEICPQCEKHLKQIRMLDEQLDKYSVRLATRESNEELMKELKGKADFFQQYIVERFRKLLDRRSVGTATEPSGPEPPGAERPSPVRDAEEADAIKTALVMKEKAIREQIAEKFTLEMKTVEMNCARKVKEVENNCLTIKTKLMELLERKAGEVEKLKEFILQERAKVSQVLEMKENEISELIKEHNELRAECLKAQDIAEVYKKNWTDEGILRHYQNKYREKCQALKAEYLVKTAEYQSVKEKMKELDTQLSEVQQKYDKVQSDYQTLHEKYKNAKKILVTYRDYISKKDAHVNNEVNRIQDEYRRIFVKLQKQLNHHINSRMQEERNVGKQTQAQQQQIDYTENINKLDEDFAKLKYEFKEPDSKSQ